MEKGHMTLEDIKHEVRALTVDQRKQLIAYLVDLLADREPEAAQRSILEFEGVGAELWQGIDAQDYVKQLRSEWDPRL
jgi:hypothetical protein